MTAQQQHGWTIKGVSDCCINQDLKPRSINLYARATVYNTGVLKILQKKAHLKEPSKDEIPVEKSDSRASLAGMFGYVSQHLGDITVFFYFFFTRKGAALIFDAKATRQDAMCMSKRARKQVSLTYMHACSSSLVTDGWIHFVLIDAFWGCRAFYLWCACSFCFKIYKAFLVVGSFSWIKFMRFLLILLIEWKNSLVFKDTLIWYI